VALDTEARHWPRPTERSRHGVDGANKLVVLFGGESTTSALQNDTWAWDGQAWTQVGDTGPIRMLHRLTFDSVRQRVVLFGGQCSKREPIRGPTLPFRAGHHARCWPLYPLLSCVRRELRGGTGRMTSSSDSSTYCSEIANPLRSALAIKPTCSPDSVNTAPFWFRSTIPRAPTRSAAPAPAAP
jgi:hypothetical protein